jgi:predicted acylesterase/phospholipase RssA
MSVIFRRLALGGGGAKGILHIGALQELSKRQPLEFPNGVYGSSIGSILATYIAFGLPIDNTVPLLKKYLVFEKIAPKPNFTQMAKSLSTKGMYEMDSFETLLIEFFQEAGLDIREKKIVDAKMPLYIVASNITKGIPTVFSKDVPVLSALKCSCCIPGVFRPQPLYDQLYVDGDMFTPAISNLVPKDETTLILNLKKQNAKIMTPENIESISPLEYIGNLYLMTMTQFYNAQKDHDSVSLFHPKLYSTTPIDEIDIEDVLQVGKLQLRRFLSQHSNQKRTESSDARFS